MKVYLDQVLIAEASSLARRVVMNTTASLERYTTVSIERAILRLFGVEGADDTGTPLVNRVVDALHANHKLGEGIATWMGRTVAATSQSPQSIAQSFASGELQVAELPKPSVESIASCIRKLAAKASSRIADTRAARDSWLQRFNESRTPWIYVIVATGNIYEDVKQAEIAANQGADVIAVIRSTAQSLLDFVPEGATTEGFAGTYATQENFRIMRKALDDVSLRVGRYIRLTNYASGLCMPEIAALGAVERLDMMLSDCMYGILFRDINARRTLVDQHFARMLQAAAGVIINTGENNYLTVQDAAVSGHVVLASQFLNYHFARHSGLANELIGLGTAYEFDPNLENSLSYAISDALLSRECFPDCPIKYMPPLKHMTGNIFQGQVLNCLYNLTSVLTRQHIHLIGMMTEAVHTPFLSDRQISMENVQLIFRAARDLGQELEIKVDGRIAGRANETLRLTAHLLQRIEQKGLLVAIEEGVFADVSRNADAGRGRDGLFLKADSYVNPLIQALHVQRQGAAV